MDLTTLSKEELALRLQTLQRAENSAATGAEALHETIESLHAYRIELEMQNRSLREAQEEILQLAKRYSDLYDNLPVGCLTVTSGGCIVCANLTAATWLHAERAAVVGEYFRSYCEPDDDTRLAMHFDRCTRNREADSIEVRLRLHDGKRMNVRLATRCAPASPESGPHLQVVMMDVSQQRQLQNVLDDIHRDQQAINASISHDLRAPLITMRSFVTMVLEEHILDPHAKCALERVLRAGKRMDDMLRGLLDYGDIAEQLNTLQRINLDEFIRGLLAELHRVIRERDAAIEVARPLPDVRGAPSLVTHAVTPIVVNALLYTRAGERPSVRIYAEEKPQTIVLSVADHGIGIDPCNHERIFRIFERLHCYSDYPGAGLGLAIARRAAEKLGGRIGVDSKLGEGACFHLELPKG